MPKLKRNAQDQEKLAENANVSVTKKQRKTKEYELSHGVHKNDSKKSGANGKIKNTFTSKQNSKKKKHGSNKFDAKSTERLDDPTKYSRDDKKMSEVPQKVQINSDGKTKHKTKNKNKYGANNAEKSDVPIKYQKNNNKTSEILEKTNSKAKEKKENNEQKQNTNLDCANKYAARVNDVKKRSKKLQMSAKESIDFESKKIKIEKFKKMAEKKLKRMSVETRETQVNTLELNKFILKIKQVEEAFTRRSQEMDCLKNGMMQLTAVGYRYLNEMLQDNNSSQSKCYFKENPNAFKIYHMGYKWQLEQWAINPLNVIISSIVELPVNYVIADFGCGEAQLAVSIPHKVHSFDFVALNDRVKTCDMAHTSLRTKSIDVAVFCLSLMGSNLNDYIIEANRILKNNGILKIAEVENRFENLKDFIKQLRSYGFKSIWKHLSHDLFYFLDFIKEKDINMKQKTLPPITLQSYLYKKR